MMMSLGRGRGGKLDEFCSTFIDPTSVATLLFFPCTEFEFIKGMSITKEFIIVLFGCEHKSIISLILVEVFFHFKKFWIRNNSTVSFPSKFESESNYHGSIMASESGHSSELRRRVKSEWWSLALIIHKNKRNMLLGFC